MRLREVKTDWKRWRQSAMLPAILATCTRAGANLLLLPLILNRKNLSASDLELWWVFGSLGGFGNLADFGFGSTIPRFYSYLLAGADDFYAEGLIETKSERPPNFQGIIRLNATVRSLYLKISLVAIGLLAIAGTLTLIRPVAESGEGGHVWWLWAAFVVVIGYNVATGHWMLAVDGLNRMREMQIALVFSGLGYLFCAAILLSCKTGLASMVIASFASGWLLRWQCRRIYKNVVPPDERPVEPDPQIVKKLWPNSCKFGVLSIGAYCLANGNVLICSQFLNKEAVDSVGLTTKLGTLIMNFAALWLGVKWPRIAILRTQGHLDEMARLFARRLTLVMLSFFVLSAILLLAGNPVLRWRNPDGTRLLPSPVLLLYLLYLAQQLFYTQFGMLAFTENVVPFFKISLFTGLGAIACSLILTPLFGLFGLIAAPFLVEASYSAWFTVRRGFQGQPLSLRDFCRQMYYLND